ncbi:MAG: hypothetical protein ACOYYS_08740 [Chloroflexota bacterium]
MAKQSPPSIASDQPPTPLPPPPVPGGPPVCVPIMLAAAWQEAHGLVLVDSKPAGKSFAPVLVVVRRETA